ncbi:hypothetical protein D018_0253B, partial [Vibrio parahaemolyticus VP2007-007]
QVRPCRRRILLAGLATNAQDECCPSRLQFQGYLSPPPLGQSGEQESSQQKQAAC